jgi:hypothetical protein
MKTGLFSNIFYSLSVALLSYPVHLQFDSIFLTFGVITAIIQSLISAKRKEYVFGKS